MHNLLLTIKKDFQDWGPFQSRHFTCYLGPEVFQEFQESQGVCFCIQCIHFIFKVSLSIMVDPKYVRPPSGYPVDVRIYPEGEKQLYPEGEKKRVVDIQPGYGDQEIRCHVSAQPVNLNSPPDYEALSYVWGDWVSYRTICLNGIPNFPVTQNLWKALRRLRRGNQPRRLWIDQICIDQQCGVERKRQIKQIRNIFSHANRVILWFGDADEHIDSSTAHIKINVDKALERAISNDQIDRWWTRAWVIEEYTLAKNPPTVMFGPYQMEWAELSSLIGRKNYLPTGNWALLGNSLGLYERLRDPKFERNLHSITIVLKGTDTLDARDKVYCILSSLPERERCNITPDYNKPVSEVFAQATYASIASTGGLGIFHLVPKLSSEKPHDTPTWALDYTFPEKNHTFRGREWPETRLGQINVAGFQGFQAAQPLFEYFLFKSGSKTKGWCQKHPQSTVEALYDPKDSQKLTLTGLEFDSVLDVLDVDIQTPDKWSGKLAAASLLNLVDPTSTTTWASRLDMKNYNPEEREIHSSIQQQLSNGNPYHRIGPLARRPVYPPSSSTNKRTVRSVTTWALFRAWDKIARPPNARKISEVSMAALPKILLEAMNTKSMDSSRASLFRWYMMLDARGVSFFTTAGGFIGLAPSDLKPDDKIVLCYGSRFPIALRRSRGGNWLFVGFVYVRGIMDGELWDCFPGLELSERRFVLE